MHQALEAFMDVLKAETHLTDTRGALSHDGRSVAQPPAFITSTLLKTLEGNSQCLCLASF